MAVTQRIDELKSEALSAVAAADSTAELEGVRVRYLGRSAEITDIKKSIGSLPPDDRKEVGRAANLASREIEEAQLSVPRSLLTSARPGSGPRRWTSRFPECRSRGATCTLRSG